MIEQKTIKVNKVSMNKDNPRVFTKANIADTVRSILTFPEMLYGIRSIAIKDNVVLGGNLRLKSLKTILDTPIEEIAKIIADNTKDKSESRITFLIDYWTEFKETKEFNFIIADNLTDAQAKEFLIKDNVSLGSWDMDILANEWDSELLNDWGVSVWKPEEEEEVEEEGDGSSNDSNDGLTEQEHKTLAERFLMPPFSVLNARSGEWQERKRQWLALGIKSELGRGGDDIYRPPMADGEIRQNTSLALGTHPKGKNSCGNFGRNYK